MDNFAPACAARSIAGQAAGQGAFHPATHGFKFGQHLFHRTGHAGHRTHHLRHLARKPGRHAPRIGAGKIGQRGVGIDGGGLVGHLRIHPADRLHHRSDFHGKQRIAERRHDLGHALLHARIGEPGGHFPEVAIMGGAIAGQGSLRGKHGERKTSGKNGMAHGTNPREIRSADAGPGPLSGHRASRPGGLSRG